MTEPLASGAVHRAYKIASLRRLRGDACAICGDDLPADNTHIEIDHIKPKARIGAKSLRNCQLTHALCNRAKSSR